jgi:hypothetical protein
MENVFDSNPKIIFFHIPKTGGMSLRGLFVKNYRTVKHFNTGLDNMTADGWNECLSRIKGMSPEEIAPYRVFKGHMQFGLHEVLPPPVEYITFLRDPVKRAVSHYMMVCRGRTFSDHLIDLSRSDWNLAKYPELCYSLDNGQTRALAGVDLDLPFGACSEKHLQMALENMDRYFQFVGLTEQFDLSLMLLGRVCGWKWHFYVPDNIAKRSVQLPPDVIEAIRSLNRFDFELYRHAQQRFQRLADSYGWGLKMEYCAYKLGNRAHRCLHIGRHWVKQHLGIERRKAMISSSAFEAGKRK